MTAVGIVAILACFAALPLFPPAAHQRGFLIFLGLLLAHVAASVAFYLYALNNPSDSALYYYDTFGLRRSNMEFGTIFVIKLVQTLKAAVGGTYLDHFLLFQVFGFWGLLLLYRCFETVQNRFGFGYLHAPYWLLFWPGMHFWTGAIGKDAPLFFAVCLALWAVTRLATRIPSFLAAIFLMVLFRPHIALLAMAALAGAAVFGSRSGVVAKGALMLVALGGLAVVGGTVNTALGVNLSDPGSVGRYLEVQQQKADWVQGASELQNSPFLYRLFSLLFRPLFVDAGGAMGLAASAENLVFIFIIGFTAIRWREALALFRSELYLRFALFFALGLTLVLTLTYYNVGLGLRQKVMMLPCILTFFVAVWLYHRSRVAALANPSADPAGPSYAGPGGPALAGPDAMLKDR